MTETNVKIIPGRPDAEVAEELRRRLIAALDPVLEAMTEAHKAGFVVAFNLPFDQAGRASIGNLTLAKYF